MLLHGNEEHLNIDKNHKTIYIKSIHRLIEVLWKLLNFMAGFCDNNSPAYGVSGYFQAHTKSRYPPWGICLVCAAHLHQYPDTVSILDGLEVCHTNARLRRVYGFIGVSILPVT